MTDIPAPVPVAELITQRRRGRYYAHDGYLSYGEVAAAWPVVGHIGAVVEANDVRTLQASATGTYGTNTWIEYHADDVQRVADAIADDTAVLRPEWLRNTEEGREAQRQWYEELHRETVRTRWIWGSIVLVLLLGAGVLWFLTARGY